MARFRIAILIVTIVFAFSLMGSHFAVAKGEQNWKKNHVAAGQHARDLMKSQPAQMKFEDAVKQLIRLLHDSDHFVHINREHLRQFSKPGFSLDAFKNKLSGRIARLENQPGDGREKAKKINKLKQDLAGVDKAYAAYIQAYSKHNKKDWPFCLAGEQYIKLEVIDGCTSFAKTFITLANASILFDDVRLIISKRYEGLQEHIDLLGTGKVPPTTINGHQMVLVKDRDAWSLVNVTFHRKGGKTGVEQFEILDQIDGIPVDPKTILYKEINLPTMQGQKLRRLVAAAVGRDRYDDLGVHTWEQAVRKGTSIPRAAFEALESTGDDAQRSPKSVLSAQEHQLLASLDPKNTALFWQTVSKGVEIRKSGATKRETTTALQAPLKTLSQDTGISLVQLESLATNLMRDVEGGLQTLREMLKGQKKLLLALEGYKAELAEAMARASEHEGRFAEVEFKDYFLTPDGQVSWVGDAPAEAEDTETARHHTMLTGHEAHSFDAIHQELRETRDQIRAVQRKINIIESQIKQLQALLED